MTKLTLIPTQGQPFKKIMQGKNWIGRVLPHAQGGFLAIIGPTTVRAATEREAFEEIAARHFGFKSAAALDAHNAGVRAQNAPILAHRRQIRAEARWAVDQAFNHGNSKPLMNIFDRVLGA